MRVENARLSWPHLFKADAYSPDQEPKFKATLVLEKGSPAHVAVSQEIKRVIAEKWPKGAPRNLIVCLRDGAEKDDLDGFGPDTVFFNAANAARPLVVDKGRNPVVESDGIIYAGCRVHALIDFWAQDNQYGKRINASLRGVQFAADDAAFGGSRPASRDEFDDLDDEAPFDEDPFGGSREGRPQTQSPEEALDLDILA